MALNPFKDSNLNDLQQNIRSFLSAHFDGLKKNLRLKREHFIAKGNEKITLMVIPHSEKKIVNFHISIFAISFIVGITAVIITLTSVLIINHSSTIKEVSKLKNYGSNSKIQIKMYKEEINKLYSIFQKMKPELTHLYSLTPGSDIDSLWARGGIDNPNPGPEAENEEDSSPPLEVLNIQEINTELETTKKILSKVKSFLEYRKKIIENTPSVWPVDGYIISRYGQRSSPYTFAREFHSGIDIEAFPGAEIRATAPGTVDDIKWDSTLGITLSIKHKYGFVTCYSHCQRVSVEIGQKISKGEVVGYVGRSGKSNNYICFYQIKIGTEYVDPMPYLNRIVP